MNKKFRQALSLATKDMGLTDKAIDRLAELGAEGLEPDADDDDINEKVKAVVPFARAMQAEITRKTRPSAEGNPPKEGREGEGKESQQQVPEWFAAQMKQRDDALAALQKENAEYRSREKAATRSALIADKASKLGIPDCLVKRLSIAESDDIDKLLTEYKQELVNNSLVPKEQGHETGNTEAADVAAAEAWAQALPDNNGSNV